MSMSNLTIGRLGAHTGVNIETIRYYERVGLMPDPPRSPRGHRIYDQGHVRRLAFIRRGRELGFRLEDIRSLLGLEQDLSACSDVKAITLEHLQGIRSRITDLQALERTLQDMIEACDEPVVGPCPVIAALSGD